MVKVTMTLGQLSCPSCLTKIQKVIEKQTGVTDVQTLFNAGKLKTVIDEEKIQAKDLAHIIEQLGYTVEKITIKEQ
ncbi:heavy metal-associated domain-containing protein [Leuconostoc fallax]|uniref:heavy-metal-associated domain-containing protein n=1 Tax=Leuconostoc fallax TaxID=1251 RepID=UPI002090F929|nr:heavy metal-associated domain-containing protein [Leuconostoc fallax]MCO6183210.1 heavy-metal-associated domain-containing protein [Leuconostoc fallax]